LIEPAPVGRLRRALSVWHPPVVVNRRFTISHVR
jgi:hypothetical protein